MERNFEEMKEKKNSFIPWKSRLLKFWNGKNLVPKILERSFQEMKEKKKFLRSLKKSTPKILEWQKPGP